MHTCSVTYTARTQPLLLCAGETQPSRGGAERIGHAYALRYPGERAKRGGRSGTLRHSGSREAIRRTCVLLRPRQRTETIAGTNAAGRSVGRRFALIVGDAGTARALTRT